MINTALSTCFTQLSADVVAAGGVMPTATAPFLEYDPYTDTCILNADTLGFNDDNASRINLYFNTSLYNLLSSFQAEFNGYNQVNNLNYRIRIYDDNGMNIFNSSSGINYLQMYQNYSTLRPLGNPVQSLVFSTGLIPSLVSAPLIFSSGGNVNNTANNDNINPIMTDFETEVTGTQGYKPLIHYIPSAEYRLKDLVGNSPLSAVQMKVFWRTQFGNLIPFKLASGCSANVKLLFRRKEFDIPIHKFSGN